MYVSSYIIYKWLAINRTIVELNCTCSNDCLPGVLNYQSYHRGIEMRTGARHPVWPHPINRTIVELKFTTGNFFIPGTFSINRTIVELKWCRLPDSGPANAYQSYHRGIEILQLKQ